MTAMSPNRVNMGFPSGDGLASNLYEKMLRYKIIIVYSTVKTYVLIEVRYSNDASFNWFSTDSSNDFTPVRRKAMGLTNADLLLIQPFEFFNEYEFEFVVC